MKTLALILLLAAWAGAEGPYVVAPATMTWMKGQAPYVVERSSGPVFAYSVGGLGPLEKETAYDLAEALNAEHERRTRPEWLDNTPPRTGVITGECRSDNPACAEQLNGFMDTK